MAKPRDYTNIISDAPTGLSGLVPTTSPDTTAYSTCFLPRLCKGYEMCVSRGGQLPTLCGWLIFVPRPRLHKIKRQLKEPCVVAVVYNTNGDCRVIRQPNECPSPRRNLSPFLLFCIFPTFCSWHLSWLYRHTPPSASSPSLSPSLFHRIPPSSLIFPSQSSGCSSHQLFIHQAQESLKPLQVITAKTEV